MPKLQSKQTVPAGRLHAAEETPKTDSALWACEHEGLPAVDRECLCYCKACFRPSPIGEGRCLCAHGCECDEHHT